MLFLNSLAIIKNIYYFRTSNSRERIIYLKYYGRETGKESRQRNKISIRLIGERSGGTLP